MLRDYGGGSNVKEKMKERIKYYSDWQKVLWATMVLVIGGSVGLIFKSGYGEARVTLRSPWVCHHGGFWGNYCVLA